MGQISQQRIAQNYSAMLDSVELINQVVAGEQMKHSTTDQKKECVSRNTVHLEMMRGQNYWTTEDMTTVDAAISTGTAFVSA